MKLSKAEECLLMYLETRAVDYYGKVDVRKMNDVDFSIAKEWNASGYVRFGRIASEDIETPTRQSAASHWCELSDGAWKDVARLRRERAERALKNRAYRRAEEL